MIRRTRPITPLALSALFLTAACASAPEREEEPTKSENAVAYAELLDEEVESDEGLFDVHRKDDELYFEIPNELLGRDLLLVSRIARVPADLAGGFIAAGHKAAEQVIRFERVDDRVLLRRVSYRNIASAEDPVHVSVEDNNFFPILAAFDVAAEGPADAAAGEEPTSVVLDVTDLFLTDVPAIGGLSAGIRKAHEVKGLDKSRSFINYARAFPQNVDVRHTQTFNASAPPSDDAAKTVSLEMHQSMILLPEEPMRPRFADHRVGWFTIRRTNYALDAQKAAEEEFLARWRLEPKDPEAYARGELVEPVKPIVYYVDPATPEKWKPYVREGIEDWQACFESAGFENAILAKDPPSPEEDPEWSGQDVRYSMVRWAATTFRNAMGPSVTDPRSGEIIESDIVWYHNHMRSYRNRLMLETGAANPLARSLPIDDELLGVALRRVITHEVGHALGLPHNMLASASYPVESLRDPEFARKMGVSASIMDYARQNYVAQPEDGLEGADFLRRIGPYDHYAIEWGYRAIPDAKTAEDEKPILDEWIVAKANDPMYRFGDRSSVDPRSQTEDLGDDSVKASEYAVANLKRVVPRLIEWTSKPGEDYTDLDELYGELIGQYARYMGHVITVVGGVEYDRKTADQDGRQYTPVSADRQRAAVAFLVENALTTPKWLFDEEILRRISSGGGDLQRIAALQSRVLSQLLDPSRMQRVAESAAAEPRNAYGLVDLLADLRKAVWANHDDPQARALARAYVGRLEWLMTNAEAEETDIPALARKELEEIAAAATALVDAQEDEVVKAHLTDVAARIAAFLEGREVE